MKDPQRLRDMRDIVFSPAWKQLLLEIKEMIRKDTESLVDKARTETDASVRNWAGRIDGEHAVLTLMEHNEQAARDATGS